MAVTQIRTRYIADGAVTKEKIPAGAGLETSKLADGANFLQKNGSVGMTGTLDMGNQKIANVLTATNNDEAVNLGQMNSAISAAYALFDGKDSVRAASTANVTVSNPGTDTFDGVTLVNGERLLLKNQTATEENGIYVFNGSGSALTRSADFNAWAEIPGAVVTVEEGTANADSIWLSTANKGGTLGTTAITWFAIPLTGGGGGYTASNFVDKEVPAGSINGSNTAFTLANTPIAGTEHVFVDGLLLRSGAGNDYTISGANITMLYALEAGETLNVSYRKS